MKTLLIFTYYWPPSGGAAVQRWLSFANFLAENSDWKVVVIAPDPETATFPFVDETLVRSVHSKVEVQHVKHKDGLAIYKKLVGKGKAPSPGFINENEGILKRLARFVRGNFYFPDPRKNWLKGAENIAQTYLQPAEKCTVITAGPPHSTHFIGKNLKQTFPKIKWIADFHDAWTDIWYYDKLYKTAPAKKVDLRMEKDILQRADLILTVGELLKNRLVEKSGISSEKVMLAPMGYDSDIDFSDLSAENKVFTMAYVGTIDAQYEAEVLFEVWQKLKSDGFEFKVDFVGLADDSIHALAEKYKLENTINFVAYVPHLQAIQYLRRANLLLLVSPKVKSEKLIIPGKVYEYLAAFKPILNLGDKSSNTALIIERCKAGLNAERTEKEEIELFLVSQINKFLEPNLVDSHSDFHKISAFSRENIASEILNYVEEKLFAENK